MKLISERKKEEEMENKGSSYPKYIILDDGVCNILVPFFVQEMTIIILYFNSPLKMIIKVNEIKEEF